MPHESPFRRCESLKLLFFKCPKSVGSSKYQRKKNSLICSKISSLIFLQIFLVLVLLSAQPKVGYYLPYAGFFASVFHEFLLCLPLLHNAICDNYQQTKVLVWKKCTCKSTFYIFKFLESLIPLVSTATPITGCSTLHEFGFITLLIKFPGSYTNIAV